MDEIPTKCLIQTRKGCVLKDETAIVLAVSTSAAVVLFIAGSTLITPLFSNLQIKGK